jgi:hypothetical protein
MKITVNIRVIIIIRTVDIKVKTTAATMSNSSMSAIATVARLRIHRIARNTRII